MVKCYKKGASISSLWVSTNDKLSDFYTSSWQRGESPVPMVVMRLMLTLFALGILTWSLIEGASQYWMIYLTNWGILLVAATTLSGFIVSVTFCCKKPIERSKLPWFVSMYWLIFNTSVAVSVMITALYWVLLYNPEVQGELGVRALWLDIATHGLTSCTLLTEVLISRTPIWLTHIYQPLGLGLWYAAFSAIYYAAGGTDSKGNAYIYEVLDWSDGKGSAIVVIGSVVALIVLYLVLWIIAFCRDKISLSLVRTTSHNLPLTPSV